MAKTKLKKRSISEKSKPVNPFEIRINKQKFDVLGRKSKNDRGLPGIARAKSIKKRKETLLQEHKTKNKTNIFMDKRLGQNKNSSMNQEESIMARFKMERMKEHNKKTMFNLADDEVLTHRGKTLSEIEKYDDPGSDEEEEFTGKGGGLEANIVESHFGGGLFREKDGTNNHASLIDELIAESKKRKAERQRAKEQTLELTDKLDADWHELLPLVGTSKGHEDTELKPKKGSYDQLMRELKFESRGVPSDRLKSEDELAKEEKEKLEKLEAERLRRMKGLEEVKVSVPKHRSADDLDDGFDIESDVDDDNNDEDIPISNIEDDSEHGSENSEDGESDTNDYEEDETDNGDLGSSCNKDDINDQFNNEKLVKGKVMRREGIDSVDEEKITNKNCNQIEEHDNDSESGSSDSDEHDDLSDLKNHSDNDELDDDTVICNVKSETSPTLKSNLDDKNENEVGESNTKKFIDTLKIKKIQMEQARKELPYTFKIPDKYDELESIMEGYNIDDQGVIIERMIKCHHPSLGESNKEKLQELLVYLLQFLNDADDDAVWKLMHRLAPHIFDLVQFSPEHSAKCFLQILKEKFEDFKKQHKFPMADVLVFLKLIPLLFPTSDVRHQITTPATIFLIQLLNQCRVQGRRAISTGLFAVTLLLEYTSLSKRYSPEVVNFLQEILEMAVPSTKLSLSYCKSRYHPLVLESSSEVKSDQVNYFSFSELSSSLPINDEYRLTALSTTVRLINCLIDQLDNITSFREIIRPIDDLLKRLEISKYPNYLKEEIRNVQTKIITRCGKLNYLILEKKKPKALRLYEPLIEKVVEGKKRKDISEEQAEQQKLLAKYKREMKGALREIRRDNAFLSKVNLRNQAKSDEERRRKVKEIYGWGADQAHELKSLKRKKKN